jgi:hypothetical protein
MVLCWLGCQSEDTSKPPPGERGEWEDTGPLAACEVDIFSSVSCESRPFKLDTCDQGSLADIPGDAIYSALYRVAPTGSEPFPFVSSFRLSADGSQDYLAGYKAKKVVGRRSLSLSAQWQSEGSILTHRVAACRAEGRRIHGCFVYCREGQVTSHGTFMAERTQPPIDDRKDSRLQLVSESFVPPGQPVDVYVTRDHAYVVSINAANNPGGLTVFDVSDKAHPVLRKVISFPGNTYWNGVWAKGDALYVASTTLGVMVFDISQPDDPRFLRSYPQRQEALSIHTVFVDGDRLYAMSPRPTPTTFIFDVSAPLTPVLLSKYEEGSGIGYPHDAFTFEGRLYINHWSSGYLIVDVSTPSRPTLLGRYNYRFAKSHANAVGRYGDRLIAFEGGETWGAHLRVLDVTDPGSPRWIGEYRLEPYASIHNMVLKGTRLFIAHYQHGVRVLDVSTPETPVEVAHHDNYRESDPGRGVSFYEGAMGIRVPGDGYVYVVDDARGLLLFPEP